MTVLTALGADMASISPAIKLNGSDLPAEAMKQLTSVRVELALRQVGRAELMFHEDGFTLMKGHPSLFALGTDVVISSGQTTLFSGAVTGIQVDQTNASQGLVTLVASDKLHPLAFGQKPLTAANTALQDVVKKIATAAGLESKVSGLPTEPLDHVLVPEAPLRFLDRLADLYGVEWWCEDKTLHVGAPAGGAKVRLDLHADVGSLSFETRDTGPGKVTMRGWDPTKKEPIVGVAAEKTEVRTSPDLNVSKVDATIDEKRPLVARGTRVNTADQATKQAQAATDAARRERTELRLQTLGLTPTLKPRTTVDLADAGPISGSYPVSAVTHIWDGAGGRTRAVAGPRRPGGLAALLASGAGAPVPAGGLAGVLLVGVVSSLADSDHQGMVKVKLPTLGDSVETGWARVILPSAGPGAGLVVPHQVNDEVIVGFEEGDLERPVVLGGVHNGTDNPPRATEVTGGKAEVAGLTSRTKHVLVVDDSSDESKNGLRFDHLDEHLLYVTKTGVTITAVQDKPIKITSGQSSIEFDGHGNVAIKGAKITIEGEQSVEIKGMTVKAEADTSMQLQSQGTAELKAQASLNIEGTAQTAVKGGIVQIN